MNFDQPEKLNSEQKEEIDIFATGIDIDDPQIIDGFDDIDKQFINSNRDLFERFNNAQSMSGASEIITTESKHGHEARETAKRMYNLVKEQKNIYHT